MHKISFYLTVSLKLFFFVVVDDDIFLDCEFRTEVGVGAFTSFSVDSVYKCALLHHCGRSETFQMNHKAMVF